MMKMMEPEWNTMESIGLRLREARERAGLSILDVEYATRISKTVLGWLEAEDFSSFESPAYAKSFLAQYSRFLQVDAQPWIDALEPSEFVDGETVKPLLATQTPLYRDPEKPMSGNRSAFTVLSISLVAIFAVVMGIESLDKRFHHEEAPPKPAAPPPAPHSLPPPPDATPEEEPSRPPRAIVIPEAEP